jgi:hypothetical protein
MGRAKTEGVLQIDLEAWTFHHDTDVHAIFFRGGS